MYVTTLGRKTLPETSVVGKNSRSDKKKVLTSSLLHQPTIDTAIGDLELIFKTPPVGSTDAFLFKYEYQSQNFLSKFSSDLVAGSVTSKQRRELAIDKMIKSEAVCHHINEIGYMPHVCSQWFEGVMYFASQFCASVLGEFDYSIFEHSRFTGGASTSRSRRHSDIAKKYDTDYSVHVTPKAEPYGNALLATTKTWKESADERYIKVVSGNRITTVPKNNKIDRCIAMEPDLNMALQLAVGSHIRSRLKRTGIDLSDQSINQILAWEGSVTDLLATIDLSSASDCISTRLVWDLLPPCWFSILDDLRSHTGELPDGKSIQWSKFSSMGNGFTFELETLLFAAICHGVAKQANCTLNFKENFHVYGDDIIVPKSIAHNVISALGCVGFSCNEEKTFTTGPFRESCGKHFYEGHDVSPFFLRTPIVDFERVCWLANRLRSWSLGSSGELSSEDHRLYDLWKIISSVAPKQVRGGCDISSTRYVVTPGFARQILVRETSRHAVKGLCALFRWFQGKTHDHIIQPSIDLYAQPGKEQLDDLYATEGSFIGQVTITVKPSVFRYRANTEMWAPVRLFVEELLHS